MACSYRFWFWFEEVDFEVDQWNGEYGWLEVGSDKYVSSNITIANTLQYLLLQCNEHNQFHCKLALVLNQIRNGHPRPSKRQEKHHNHERLFIGTKWPFDPPLIKSG